MTEHIFSHSVVLALFMQENTRPDGKQVERLVYYFRYVAMWSRPSEILNHKIVSLEINTERESERERAKKNTTKYVQE